MALIKRIDIVQQMAQQLVACALVLRSRQAAFGQSAVQIGQVLLVDMPIGSRLLGAAHSLCL
jgi:hypothetical protein